MTSLRPDVASSHVLAVGMAVWLVLGCRDDTGAGPEHTPRVAELPALILSDPTTSNVASTRAGRASLVQEVCYVSLPPGSLPDGERVEIVNVRRR